MSALLFVGASVSHPHVAGGDVDQKQGERRYGTAEDLLADAEAYYREYPDQQASVSEAAAQATDEIRAVTRWLTEATEQIVRALGLTEQRAWADRLHRLFTYGADPPDAGVDAYLVFSSSGLPIREAREAREAALDRLAARFLYPVDRRAWP